MKYTGQPESEAPFGTSESFDYKEYFKGLAKVDLDELKEFYEFIKNGNI